MRPGPSNWSRKPVRSRPISGDSSRSPAISPRRKPFPPRGFDRAFEGSETAWLGFCRADHRVRLHAGDGPDQRSRRGLCYPWRGRCRASAFPATGLTGTEFIDFRRAGPRANGLLLARVNNKTSASARRGGPFQSRIGTFTGQCDIPAPVACTAAPLEGCRYAKEWLFLL